MAAHASNGIETIAFLSTQSKEDFRPIWHLDSVQIAKTDDGFWLKGFSQDDLKSTAVLSTPKLQVFELTDQFLYKKGNRVPERKLPSGLLWHPIQRALKVALPSFNENLFEINGELKVEFVASSEAQEVVASIVAFDDILKYVDTVPNYEFNDLHWCIIEKDQVVLFGKKILPLVSTRYWKFQDLLIPVGYDLKYSFLKQIITDFKLNENKSEYWVFETDGRYFPIPKDQLVSLSRSSVKHMQ